MVSWRPPKEHIYYGLKTEHVTYIIIAVLIIASFMTLGHYMKLASAIPTGSTSYTPSIMNEYVNNPYTILERYNEFADKAPSTIKLVFGDERINATVNRIDGTTVNLAIETNNGWIINSTKGEMPNPTINAEIDETTVKRIYESESPIKELENAMDNGEINYDSERILTSIKIGIETIFNMVSLFS